MHSPRDLLAAVVVVGVAGCGGTRGGVGDGGQPPDGSPPVEICPREEIGVICTVAGDGEPGATGDGGLAREASLSLPVDVEFGPDGSGYLVDWNNGAIRAVDPESGVITRFAGTGDLGVEGCEVAVGADARDVCLNHPTGIAFDEQGQAVIAAWMNSRIVRVDPASGAVTAVYGDGRRAYAGDGGPATAASFDLVSSLAPDGDGGLYLMDQHNQVIRFVDRDGVIDRYAGQCVVDHVTPCEPEQEPVACPDSGKHTCGIPAETCRYPCSPGFAEGAAGEIRMAMSFGAPSEPNGQLVLSPDGDLFFSDSRNRRVRVIRAGGGAVDTVAGTGEEGVGGDGGPAIEAQLTDPADLALAADGSLFIADPWANCVRRVSPDGIIDTVAGVCGAERGFAGDGGPATEAVFKVPFGVALHQGVLYIADTGNNRLRAVRLE